MPQKRKKKKRKRQAEEEEDDGPVQQHVVSHYPAVHAVVTKVCCYSVVAHVQSTISPYNAKVKEKRRKRKRHHDIGKETVPASYGFDLGYSYQTAGQGGGSAAVEDKVSVLCSVISCAAHC